MNTTETPRPSGRQAHLAGTTNAATNSLSPRRRSGERVRERGVPMASLPSFQTPLPNPLPARPSRGEGARPRAPGVGGRRQFLLTGLFSLIAGFFSGRSAAAAATKATGEPVTTRMRQGEPPGQPLDTMLLFERGDDNNGPAITHEVLSLIHQEKGKHSYPWTMYASLETHHETGDACVVCSRLHKHGPGWSSGLHSEVFNHSLGVAPYALTCTVDWFGVSPV